MGQCQEPKCDGEVIEKYWGGGDIRAVCLKCGNFVMGRENNAKQQHDVNVQHSEG